MTFDPLIPPSLWMALATIGVALLIWYAMRRPEAVTKGRWALAILLMTAALATVLLVLLNATWVSEIPPPAGKPLLNLLVDDSGSMGVADAGEGATRFQSAAKIAASVASKLDDKFDVHVRTFSETSAPLTVKELASHPAKGQGTDLSMAVADALADDRPQGQAVVLLSDGIHNAAGGAQPVLETVRRAKSLSAPIYTRTIGTGGASMDLAVELRSPQDLAFMGQQVPITVRVTARGIRAGQANVTLLYDGKEIGRQPANLGAFIAAAERDPNSPELRFWVKQEKVGMYPYEVRVDPLPGESTQANNSATYVLRVIDQPIKVLLVEGKPYWDSKFLMRTLSSVPAVELDSIVRVADGRLIKRSIKRKTTALPDAATHADVISAGPTTAPDADSDHSLERTETWAVANDAADIFAHTDKLKDYQIIVLGREAESFLTDPAVANLQDWVAQEGGALVCSRGSPTIALTQRLAKLLPVKWTPGRETRFRMRLTDNGRDLHWLGEDRQEDRRLAGLPTLASAASVDRSKPLAVVLATGVSTGGETPDGSPAVIYQPYGSGRVVVIEGAGMWRWAFLPPQYQQQEEVYAALWHSLLRWMTGSAGLLPGQKVALRADKISFATDESATATLLLREEAVTKGPRVVELISPGSQTPQAFTPTVLGEDAGSFRVNFGKLPAGRYQARVAGAGDPDIASRCVFDVRVIGQEEMDLQTRPDLMARIATDSGGAVLGDDPAGEIAAKFKEHLARTRPPRYERSTAWDRPWILVAVFGLWTASWAVRRSGGLI